jgi:hypothetical protein
VSAGRQTGGGAEAFVGGEGSPVAGEDRGMFLYLRGKEKTIRRGHIQANRVWGGAHLRPGKAATFRPKIGEVASPVVRRGRRVAGGWHGSARTLGWGERWRGVCAPDNFVPKLERKDTERGEDPARAQGRKREEGWGPGSGRHVEGRTAWGGGGVQSAGTTRGRWGWAAVSTTRQHTWGQGRKGGSGWGG